MPKVKSLNPQQDAMRKLMEHALVEKEWDKQHLADICGCKPQRISKIFKEPDKLNFSTLCLIYKKLGIKSIPILINAKTGSIYNITLDIAKSEDGRTILYATKGKIKRVGSVAVNSLIKRGSQQKSNSNDIISTPTEKSNKNFSENDSKNVATDSAGNKLSKQQQEYFKDSKVRDENGNLLVVYHGTDADFTVFDKTKGRANMDIQGLFFSPWELDAGGYGSKVLAGYLNITNPAPESVGYKALNKFKGQNNAGVKAREYLISLGYDGVNNGNEEYIAFESNQFKNADNRNPTSDPDISFSSGLMEQLRYNSKEYAKRMLRKYGIRNDTYAESVAESLDEIVKLYNKGGKNISEAEYKLDKLCIDIAESMPNTVNEWSKEIIDYVKGTVVSVSETQKSEILNSFNSLREFQKETGIKIIEKFNKQLVLSDGEFKYVFFTFHWLLPPSAVIVAVIETLNECVKRVLNVYRSRILSR